MEEEDIVSGGESKHVIIYVLGCQGMPKMVDDQLFIWHGQVVKMK